MSDLYSIAKSGLQAYKEQLATTGQNIANVGNDGYARRETLLAEIKHTSADVLQISNQTGFGVKVDGVIRAFDEFINTQLHTTQSNFSFSDTQTSILAQLEQIVRPKTGGVSQAISNFFTSLNAVSQDASSIAARNVAIEAAKTLTYTINNVAKGINDLRGLANARINDDVETINNLLDQLSNVHNQTIGLTKLTNIPNALLDQRDLLLDRLSTLIDIDIEYKNNGTVNIRSGTAGQSTLIFANGSPLEFNLMEQGGSPRVFVRTSENSSDIKLNVQSGTIAGYLAADHTLIATKSVLDQLAKKISVEFNQIQKQGLDFDGLRGEKLFTLDHVDIQKKSTSSSNSTLQILGDATQLLDKEVHLEYDQIDNTWSLKDNNSKVLGTFDGSFSYSGVNFELSGTPQKNDQFIIKFSSDNAENLKTVITDGKKLAAASFYVVENRAENIGSARLTVNQTTSPQDQNLRTLNDLFVGTRNSANSIQFKNGGILGALDNIDSLKNFTALKKQDKLQFSLSTEHLHNNSNLNLSLSGQNYTFSLTSNGLISSWADLSERLNEGIIKSEGTSMSFSDLGLKADGSGNTFIISSASNSGIPQFKPIISGNIDDQAGILLKGTDTPANIQILTREGVHIAGSPLSDAEAFKFITTSNGFTSDASYTARHLQRTNDSSYLGATVKRITPEGDYRLNLSADGELRENGLNITVGAGSPPIMSNVTNEPFTIVMDSNREIEIQTTLGMTVGALSDAINEQTLELGINATAVNQVEIFDIGDGQIIFDLKSDNSYPLNISAFVREADTTALVEEINKYTSETNVKATNSGNGSIVLEHLHGNEIVISSLNDVSGNIKARQLNRFGEVLNNGSSANYFDIDQGGHLVAGGHIVLESPIEFKINDKDGVVDFATKSEFLNGFVSKEFDLITNSQAIKFETNALIDGGHESENGLNPVAAASSYSLDLSSDNPTSQKISATLLGLTSESLNDAKIAAAMASEFRKQAPKTTLIGGSFSIQDGFPKNGDSIELKLGDEIYTATVSNIPDYTFDGIKLQVFDTELSAKEGLEHLVEAAKFTITGPENNRIYVGFSKAANDEQFQFFATAKDGILSGQNITLSTNNTVEALTAFNLHDTNSKSVIYSTEFSSVNASPQIAQLIISDEIHDIGLDVDGNLIFPELNGVSASIEAQPDGERRLKIEIDLDLNDENIRLKAVGSSDDYGVSTSSAQLSVVSDKMYIKNLDGFRIESSATIKSLADEVFNISGFNAQDLIVLASGLAEPIVVGSIARNDTISNQSDITVKVRDTANKRLELFDTASGDYLGTRQYTDAKEFLFDNLLWSFTGDMFDGDEFVLTTNKNNKDDATNIQKLLDLATLSESSGRGGYAELYNHLIIDVGFSIKSAETGLEGNKSALDLAIDRKSEFSGVDLDTEAARLLEQQQAYQALARVLSTAQELVDTLLRSM